MELLFEAIIEMYLEMMMLVVPEKEEASKKYKLWATLFAVAVMFAVVALFVWGVVLLVDYGNNLGYVPIIIAAMISLSQIALGLYLCRKKYNKNKP